MSAGGPTPATRCNSLSCCGPSISQQSLHSPPHSPAAPHQSPTYLHGVGHAARQAGDAAHALQEVECHALGHQDRTSAAARAAQHLAWRDGLAVGGSPSEGHAGVYPSEDRGRHPGARQHASRLAQEGGGGLRALGHPAWTGGRAKKRGMKAARRSRGAACCALCSGQRPQECGRHQASSGSARGGRRVLPAARRASPPRTVWRCSQSGAVTRQASHVDSVVMSPRSPASSSKAASMTCVGR